MAGPLEQQIIEAVDRRREQVIAFLQQLVQFNSERGHEGQIQEFIAGRLRQMGLTVEEFVPDVEALKDHPAFQAPDLPLSGRPNVVGRYRGSGGGRSLLFNGHVDTVVAGPADQWTDGPFSGVLRNASIYGRGASDMKAGLAAMTMALGTLLEMGHGPSAT